MTLLHYPRVRGVTGIHSKIATRDEKDIKELIFFLNTTRTKINTLFAILGHSFSNHYFQINVYLIFIQTSVLNENYSNFYTQGLIHSKITSSNIISQFQNRKTKRTIKRYTNGIVKYFSFFGWKELIDYYLGPIWIIFSIRFEMHLF